MLKRLNYGQKEKAEKKKCKKEQRDKKKSSKM